MKFKDAIKKLEELCKEYDLPVFESPRDNFLMILESAEPTKQEKWEALDCYDSWLLEISKDV